MYDAWRGCVHEVRSWEGKTLKPTHPDIKIYRVWLSMRNRCSPKHRVKKYYYDRGIKVCKRWNKFENFKNDMGRRNPGLTIDRINNNGNYSPSNCRWATRQEQMENTRTTILIQINDVQRTLSGWAKLFGITQSALSHYVRRNNISHKEAVRRKHMAKS